MNLSMILYGVASILTIYVVVSIAVNKRITTADAIALLGIVVTMILAQRGPGPIDSPLPTETPIISPSNTETPNWAISFEYRFPAGFWSVGMHEYTYDAECPNLDLDGNGGHNASRTQTFEVLESAALLSGDIYLRLSGLRDGPFESNVVDKTNPSQTTTAVWSLLEITHEEAELAATDCSITITWDGGTPKPLKPGLAFQR